MTNKTNKNLTRTIAKNQELRKGAGVRKEDKRKTLSILDENMEMTVLQSARLLAVCLSKVQSCLFLRY